MQLKCYMCGDPHPVSLCPKLNQERRKELAANIAFEDTVMWWLDTGNREKARQYAIAHQWAARTCDPTGEALPAPPNVSASAGYIPSNRRLLPSPRSAFHGIAHLLGTTRRIYFDLGGDYNLLDECLYQIATMLAREESSGVRVVTATELGYAKRGVPIDMAGGCSSGSSLVWVTEWAKLALTIETNNGRCLHLTDQLVGFVPRSTPLMLLGQEACSLCGYRTIEQQDTDRTGEEEPNATSAERSSLGGGAGLTAVHKVSATACATTEPEGAREGTSVMHGRASGTSDEGNSAGLGLTLWTDAAMEASSTNNEAGTLPAGYEPPPPVYEPPPPVYEQPPPEDGRHSPAAIADVGAIDYMDLPGLIELSESSSESETSSEELDSDSDDGPLSEYLATRYYRTAHMQRATSVASALEVDATAMAGMCCSTAAPTPVRSTAEHRRAVAMVEEYVGNLLESTADLIVHQTNCQSTAPGGLAAAMFARFPHANFYSTREGNHWPGTIMVCGDGISNRRVVNLHGQCAPGGPRRRGPDTRGKRVQYFQQGLECLRDYVRSTTVPVRSITFPANIGCGLGGGEWATYMAMIIRFASEINMPPHEIKVRVCRLPTTFTPAVRVLNEKPESEPDAPSGAGSDSSKGPPPANGEGSSDDNPPDLTDARSYDDIGGPVDAMMVEDVIVMDESSDETPVVEDIIIMDDSSSNSDSGNNEPNDPAPLPTKAARPFVAPLIDLTAAITPRVDHELNAAAEGGKGAAVADNARAAGRRRRSLPLHILARRPPIRTQVRPSTILGGGKRPFQHGACPPWGGCSQIQRRSTHQATAAISRQCLRPGGAL